MTWDSQIAEGQQSRIYESALSKTWAHPDNADLPAPPYPCSNQIFAMMADTDSLDRLLPALYASISGPAGAPRDWTRLRSFFYPGAILFRTAVTEDASPEASFMSVDEFIESAEPYFHSYSFFEVEIARTVQTFGFITHVMSTYESRKTANGEPFARGINSIQLYHDGSRWWIVSMLWDVEREGNPIPKKYLP